METTSFFSLGFCFWAKGGAVSVVFLIGQSILWTVEKSIPLSKGSSTFPLFSKNSISTRLRQIRYGYVHVGMIQVALKPTKLGSNASATVYLRDKRFLKFRSSVLGMVESSLSDGPIYFSCFPSHCVALSDSSVSFSNDVKVKGDGNVTLMYKFHYKVMKFPWLFNMSRHCVDGSGETTLYLTKIGESNRVVSRKILWGQTGVGEEGSTAENNLASASG